MERSDSGKNSHPEFGEVVRALRRFYDKLAKFFFHWDELQEGSLTAEGFQELSSLVAEDGPFKELAGDAPDDPADSPEVRRGSPRGQGRQVMVEDDESRSSHSAFRDSSLTESVGSPHLGSGLIEITSEIRRSTKR